MVKVFISGFNDVLIVFLGNIVFIISEDVGNGDGFF